MNSPTRCPECGAEHTDAREDGLCRRCVLAAAVHAVDTFDPESGSEDDLAIAGDTIGPYRLLEKLGEGGMGVVHLAERTGAVRGKVALKLVKWGMDTKQVLARFEAERTALSLMDHPNIATVLDGGATDNGRPYFVMEYVKGESITTYCDRQRLRTRQRLELFIEVCEGVQHAHQKGIIHRDLKPSNVLVQVHGDRHVPKIIDFGVAKATALRLTERTLHTQLGQRIGTPEYMSPEQAEMTPVDIDTRSDVYSLGVLLYELLTGTRPFDLRKGERSDDEIRRLIREEEPAKPSARLSTLDPDTSAQIAKRRRTDPGALRRRLRGDLDWIVLKALEKSRTRRYASATELAEDVRRHLRDEAVLAGPPSTTYQIRKFARRHRVGVAATGALGILLVGFSATMAVQSRRVAFERDRASAEAERATAEAEAAREVSDFLVGVFELSDPTGERANTVTAKELLDRSAQRIDRELADQPRLQARLMDTMGRVYMSLATYDLSEVLLEQALEIRENELGDDHLELAASLANLGQLRTQQARYDEAVDLVRRSLSIREAQLGLDHEATVSSLYLECQILTRTGQFEAGVHCYDRAVPAMESLYGRESRQVAQCLNDLGWLYGAAGRSTDAQHFHKEALQIRERVLGPDHPDTAKSLGNLAVGLYHLGMYEEAAPMMARAAGILERELGSDHPSMLPALINPAELHLQLARKLLGLDPLTVSFGETLGPDTPPEWADNIERARSYLERARSVFEANPTERRLAPYEWLAALAGDTGHHREAEEFYLKAIAVGEESFARPRLAFVRENYARLLRAMGRESDALEQEELARSLREQAANPES